MYDLAIILSIVSSILLIIYLIGLIFGQRKSDKDSTITITGRVVTTTFTETRIINPLDGERVVDGEIVDNNSRNAKSNRDLPNEI
jgi:hypothetical protein